ncbi:MAG: efflux RND transporter periplasmic adaptor subunit [bacterium]
MKKIIIILLLIGIIAGVIFYMLKDKDTRPDFRTEKIAKGDIIEAVTASGTVNPVTNISVGTQVSGTVKNIYVDFNSPVKKGQILAEIDPSLLESQVEQSMANLYNAKANLQKIQSITENDLKTFQRKKSLYEKDFIARSEVDLAESTYNADKAQIESAQAQIAQAKAELRNKQTNLRYTKIISPVNGIVISKNVDVGQTVAASFQTPTLFLVAQDLTKMQIDTNVAEADIGKIKAGQKAEYTLDGYPDEAFEGKVRQIRIAPNVVQNVVTYNVVINVNNKDLKLKPGMTANVSIITSKKENILLVPNTSLRFTLYEGENTPKYKEQGIWILEENRKPKRIRIKTGISNGEFTEIISGNISEGLDVIVSKLDKSKKQKNKSPKMRMF